MNATSNPPARRAVPAGSRPAPLLNTAGEWEGDARSRGANLAEALAVMLGLLGALWGVAYPFGVLGKSAAANRAAQLLLAGLAVFVLGISPRLHGDTAAAWGLGRPAELGRRLRRAAAEKRAWLPLLVAGGAAAWTWQLYHNLTGTARLMSGLAPAAVFQLPQDRAARWAAGLLCAALAGLWMAYVVRYDNFRTAWRGAVRIWIVLLPLALLAAWLGNGPEAFHFPGRGALGEGVGYLFWGAVQQALFCGYFNTRLRRAFAPARSQRPWKRLGVAALNGSFFGLAHLNHWLLAGGAAVLGAFLAWHFMRERYRNLQVMGLAHGVLGAAVLWLFTRPGGRVRISLNVGPWALSGPPDGWTLAVAAAAMAALGGGIAVVWRARRQRPNSRMATPSRPMPSSRPASSAAPKLRRISQSGLRREGSSP